jgi:hypothetical protein
LVAFWAPLVSAQADPTDYKPTKRFGSGGLPIEWIYQPIFTSFPRADDEMTILKDIVLGLKSEEKFRPVWDLREREASHPAYADKGWKHYCFTKECSQKQDLDENYLLRILLEKCLWRADPLIWLDYMINTANIKSKNIDCYGNPSLECFWKM